MIKNLMTRIFALLLCVCLLPAAALANVFEDAMAQSNDGVTPVTRSDFELLFHFIDALLKSFDLLFGFGSLFAK